MSLPDDESHSPASVSTTCLTSDHSCKPCVFFLKPQGCRNGADCSFCHLCHPKSRKAKKEEMMPKYVEFSEEAVSKGSAKHGVDCKPCAWFWHPNGCQSGSLCEFCHLCPVGELKARQKERTKLLRAAKEQPANQNVAQAQPEEGEGLPSIGSAAHGTECRPCAWFWKEGGCKNGKECRHCHLCPEGEIRRKKKVKQEEMKANIRSSDTESNASSALQLLQLQLLHQWHANMAAASLAALSCDMEGYYPEHPF